MFKNVKEWFESKIESANCVSGLSEGMEIVDKYLRPGMNPRALDFSAGYAQARIHGLYESGRITRNEMKAALATLENQLEKLHSTAMIEAMIG